MPYLETVKRVNASPVQLWEVIGDFAHISKFHPLIKDSQHLSGAINDKGGERSCTFNDGSSIKERLLDYVEGEKYTVEIYEFGKFPLKKAIVSIGLREVKNDPESSVMYMHNQFKPKFGGALGWLMGKLMTNQFNKIQGQLIESAEFYALNGKKKAA